MLALHEARFHGSIVRPRCAVAWRGWPATTVQRIRFALLFGPSEPVSSAAQDIRVLLSSGHPSQSRLSICEATLRRRQWRGKLDLA